jgi:YesN/AraC family two-component response regulator
MNCHTVVTAPNGCAGLEMLKETCGTPQQFDLVITDMQMPGKLYSLYSEHLYSTFLVVT